MPTTANATAAKPHGFDGHGNADWWTTHPTDNPHADDLQLRGAALVVPSSGHNTVSPATWKLWINARVTATIHNTATYPWLWLDWRDLSAAIVNDRLAAAVAAIYKTNPANVIHIIPYTNRVLSLAAHLAPSERLRDITGRVTSAEACAAADDLFHLPRWNHHTLGAASTLWTQACQVGEHAVPEMLAVRDTIRTAITHLDNVDTDIIDSGLAATYTNTVPNQVGGGPSINTIVDNLEAIWTAET